MKYDDRDIVGAIRTLRDMICELTDLVEVKKEKKDKLDKLRMDIKKIELTRR